MFVCLFVNLFTDSGSSRSVALLRMEPALPEGSRPSRAGRRGPFRAPDADPSLGRAPGEFALQGSRAQGIKTHEGRKRKKTKRETQRGTKHKRQDLRRTLAGIVEEWDNMDTSRDEVILQRKQGKC